MSWQDIMQRVLPPIGGISPSITRAGAYGAIKGRTPPSSIPHGGVDFNYYGGQTGINLTHPALRSPVTGIVTNAGQGTVGKIAIRDANGFSHEILHTHSRHVAMGDPVAAGQLIGTMGNTGAHDQHVHYQLKDPAGNTINPTTFWDRQGPTDPNPSPPAFVREYQQYLQNLGVNAGNGLGDAPDTASRPKAPFPPNGARPPDQPDSFAGRFGKWAPAPAGIPSLSPSDRSDSFDTRFGNWGSVPSGSSGDAVSPLLRALEKYKRSAASDSAAPVAAIPSPTSSYTDNSRPPILDPTNPPPLFAPPNYYESLGDDSVQRYIASLAGIDPDDPDHPPVSPLFNRISRS